MVYRKVFLDLDLKTYQRVQDLADAVKMDISEFLAKAIHESVKELPERKEGVYNGETCGTCERCDSKKG